MSNYEVKTEIAASASAVYRELMSFESYPSWNSMVIEIKGVPEVGSQLEVRVKLGARSPMTFKPTVVKNDMNKEFRWAGVLFSDWLYRGEHYFIIEEQGEQRCTFVHGEMFSGLCEPLFTWILGENMAIGFKGFNDGLKERVEDAAKSEVHA